MAKVDPIVDAAGFFDASDGTVRCCYGLGKVVEVRAFRSDIMQTHTHTHTCHNTQRKGEKPFVRAVVAPNEANLRAASPSLPFWRV